MRTEHWTYFSEYPRFTGERTGPTFAAVSSAGELDFERHRQDRLIAGSPDDCIEQIRALEARVGLDYLVMTFRMAHGPASEHERDAIRLFAAEVMPAFRSSA